MRQGSHVVTPDAVKLLDNTRSNRLFKIYLGELFVNNYF
jgi:hypothetical protein